MGRGLLGDGAGRSRLLSLLPLVGLVLIAVALSWSHWDAQPQWTPDGLFYEEQARELTGTPAATARQDVFFGPLGKSASDTSGRLDGHAWVAYAAPFFRRRWVVPAMAAALRPAAGVRALELVSLLGYVLSGLAVYLLARRRFSTSISFAAGAFALWFPPLRAWAGHPLTDTMGVATLALAIAAAAWALQGSRARLLLWASSVLLLSFTRDTAAIAVVAAAWLALAKRSRRTTAVAGTGLLAAAPAPLLFGAPLKKTMAFTFSDNKIPADPSWHYVVHRYGTYALSMLNFDFPFRSAPVVAGLLLGLVALLALQPERGSPLSAIRHWTLVIAACLIGVAAVLFAPLQLPLFSDPVPAGVLLLMALLPLFLPGGGDSVTALLRGGAVGSVGYLFLLPQNTDLRLGLVVLPFAALGFARALALARRAQSTESRSTTNTSGSCGAITPPAPRAP